MDIAQQIASLRDELEDLKRELTEARKKGRDTKISELIVMGIAPKLQYAEISEEAKDIEKVRRLLNQAKEELDSSAEI